MWRYFLPLLVLALLVFTAWAGLYRDPRLVPSPLVGRQAPEFSLPTLKDSAATFSSEQFIGQVSVVNVWGSWCVGCRVEHEALMRFSMLTDVPIYGINYKDEKGNAFNWLEQLGDPYVLSGYDYDGLVSIDWGVYGAPETFVIDKRGVIRYKKVGPITNELIQNTLLPLLEILNAEQP